MGGAGGVMDYEELKLKAKKKNTDNVPRPSTITVYLRPDLKELFDIYIEDNDLIVSKWCREMIKTALRAEGYLPEEEASERG